jgi:hypothetical protein
MSKFCIFCGSEASLNATFCSNCGRKLSNESKHPEQRLVVFGMTDILTVAAAFVALVGAILGLISASYFIDIHGFSRENVTLLIISFSGFASFTFLAIGLISAGINKRKQF